MEAYDLYLYLKDNKISSLEQLLEHVEFSDSTARRRLKQLAEAGLIEFKRGGIIEITPEVELSIEDSFKQQSDSFAKKMIGKRAASFVEDGDIIYIDNGTTVRQMLPYLKGKRVIIYTNGYNHIELASKYNIDINIIPGEVLAKEASIVGMESLNYLHGLFLHKAFIGTNGYDEEGIYTPHRREMILKQFALRHAKQGYVLCEKSKQNVKSKYKVCERQEFTLITD